MRNLLSTLVGKGVRQLARLRGGGGSAIPGLVVEKIDRGYMARMLDRLPYGVVVVSGTNGKTTTTKMIVEILESLGLRVFTNRTGSNFSRGVVAAIALESSLRGRLSADIAVLELDEAHAMYFIDRVPPKHTLLLNVLRDQLDRFGEIDVTARLLQRIADATTHSLVVNRDDELVAAIGERTRARATASAAGVAGSPADSAAAKPPRVVAFGMSAGLAQLFPSENQGAAALDAETDVTLEVDVELVSVDHDAATSLPRASFLLDGELIETPLQLEGLYNTANAAAALATVRAIVRDSPGVEASNGQLIDAVSRVRPAFGRGERLELDGDPLELVLVKNPAGFQLALASYAARDAHTMIAINDAYADGRDVSWLWDVRFDSLAAHGVAVVSGSRSADMALRLLHDDVAVEHVTSDLAAGFDHFREHGRGRAARIYCTYTAMLELRERLAELTEVEAIW